MVLGMALSIKCETSSKICGEVDYSWVSLIDLEKVRSRHDTIFHKSETVCEK